MKRTQLERKPEHKGFKTRGGLSKGRSRLKAGKKTNEWNNVRRKLKPRFEEVGITACEFRFSGCQVLYNLSFAHAVKRDFLKADAPLGSPEHIETVALACTGNCHKILDEVYTHSQMKEAVMAAIARREMPV